MNNVGDFSPEVAKVVRQALTGLDIGFSIYTDEEIRNISQPEIQKLQVEAEKQKKQQVERMKAELKAKINADIDKEAQIAFEAEKQRLLKSAEATREAQIQTSIQQMKEEVDKTIAHLQLKIDNICQEMATATPNITDEPALKKEIEDLIKTRITKAQKEADRLEQLAKFGEKNTPTNLESPITDDTENPIFLYNGPWDDWKAHPDGVVIKIGRRSFLNGEQLLFDEKDDVSGYDPYTGKPIYDGGWYFWNSEPKCTVVQVGCKLLSKNGGLLYEGDYYYEWQSHPDGVVIKVRNDDGSDSFYLYHKAAKD